MTSETLNKVWLTRLIVCVFSVQIFFTLAVHHLTISNGEKNFLA